MKYRVTTNLLVLFDRGQIIDTHGDIYDIAELYERNPDWFEPVEEVQEGQYWKSKETGGEWAETKPHVDSTQILQELKEKVKGLTVELDVRYNLAITDVIALIEDMQDE